ncbi:MAG TPA: metallophosphoesterase [Methylomirabilota bacterium]|nr:metallophosphoesterase [Methylomirabilota bacterium]
MNDKIALITDTHYGVRGDQVAFLDNNTKFFNDVFFPALHEYNIQTVVHLGDMVDRRTGIDFNTAMRLRTEFIDRLRHEGRFLHWILGNHDIYWRNKTSVNIAEEIYGYLDISNNHDFKYYINPEEVRLNDLLVLFIPWVCETNAEITQQLINTTSAQVCFGHLELTGFEMYKGMFQREGQDPEIYKKFDLVCTGHYHHKSVHNNIHYLGATGEFSWSDYNDPRGFHIFNTVSRTLDYIQNPYTMHAKVFYDDAGQNASCQVDFESLRDKIVKVIVKSRTNLDQYNNFIIQVEKSQPLDLNVVEDHLNLDLVSNEVVISDVKETLTIIRDYITSTNNIVDAVRLDNLIVDLYKQAQGIEQ